MCKQSVLWRCWLGGRNGIRPVKNWVLGCWCGYLYGARCRLAYIAQLMPLPLTVPCFSKTRLVLPFWYRLTQVVLEKGLLNGFVCVSYCCSVLWYLDHRPRLHGPSRLGVRSRPQLRHDAAGALARARRRNDVTRWLHDCIIVQFIQPLKTTNALYKISCWHTHVVG